MGTWTETKGIPPGFVAECECIDFDVFDHLMGCMGQLNFLEFAWLGGGKSKKKPCFCMGIPLVQQWFDIAMLIMATAIQSSVAAMTSLPKTWMVKYSLESTNITKSPTQKYGYPVIRRGRFGAMGIHIPYWNLLNVELFGATNRASQPLPMMDPELSLWSQACADLSHVPGKLRAGELSGWCLK